jgi:DNA ligase-1
MSKQGNLDSFFGVAKEKRVSKQTKLSFAPKSKKEAPNTKQQDDVEPTKPEKENKSNGSSDAVKDDLMDTDEEEMEQQPQRKRAAPSNNDKKPAARTRKRAILDDDSEDDDDDDEFQPNNAENKEEKEEDKDMSEEEEEEEPVEKKPAPKKSKVTQKPAKGAKKSELAAHAMKTNDDLLQNETISWKKGESVPFAAVCDTFERIEAISSRLEIQELLTELFRRVLLRNPKDLYQLIYLTSNTVAPAYECVELGIGDSILIKAIGEAYGSNPGM